MEGCNLVAREKSPATSLFDSPSHLFMLPFPIRHCVSVRTPADTIKLWITHRLDSGRLIKVAPLSFANALASNVFPQPG